MSNVFHTKQIILSSRPVGMAENAHFSIEDNEVGNIETNEVVVKVNYISLDPAMRGWMNAGMTYIQGVELGNVMRAFGVGEVVASASDEIKIGDIVTGLFGVQSYAKMTAKHVTKVDNTYPQSWHLGILGMPGMTAYFGLLDKGKLQDSESVFVSGASGMVGSLVGQIAKLKGCRVVGSASSDEKCNYLINDLNFDGAINYNKEEMLPALKKLLPNGVDVFFDNVGGQTLDAGLACIAMNARIVICGAISQYNGTKIEGPKNYLNLLSKRGTMSGLMVFDYMHQYPVAVKQLSQWIEEGKLQYKEHVEEGIERYVEVLNMLYTSQNFGKLVLKV